MTDTNVRVGSLVFSAGAGTDGFYIRKGGLKGLFDAPGVRSDRVERQNAHGDFDLPVFRSGRIVSVSGPCIATSETEWLHRNRQFTGLLADGDSGRVTFETALGTIWGDAKLADAPQWEPTMWGSRADYLLQLKFADPRLYGDVRTSGPASSVDVFHYGNFPGLAVLTVTGSAGGGYTITGPAGKQYIVTQPLVSGTPHQISMRDGYLRINGSVVVGGVSRGDTWTIPPGVVVPLSISAGQLSVRVRDTFV